MSLENGWKLDEISVRMFFDSFSWGCDDALIVRDLLFASMFALEGGAHALRSVHQQNH